MKKLVIIIALVLGNIGFSQELKIVDKHNLTRAVADISSKAKVIVIISGESSGSEIVLESLIDSGNTLKAMTKNGEAVFNNVKPQVWKIKSKKGVKIKKVKIK